MIVGSPRSGTTWIGSILDSHPDTLYLHEPDVIEKEPRLPFIPSPSSPDPADEVSRAYVQRLAANRALRTVFARERFAKSYRGRFADRVRQAVILAARSADAALPPARLDRRVSIPDLAARPPALTIVKSVDSVTRLPAFARANPDMPFIHIIRHPCGVARSKLRGVEQGKMATVPLYDDLFSLPPAKDTAKAETEGWPLLKRAAFDWMVKNEWVLAETDSLPNVSRLIYDRVANDPHSEAEALFAQLSLPPSAQTRDYLDRLVGTEKGQGDYFAIARNPAKAANEWQSGLSEDDKALIAETVGGSNAGALFGY
ncbi:hypothetical protein B5C34_00225 [Pacificimonas flava]|uniref:Sulfotransferase n=3 Tax=Pacificimonas TaxID=1960290 RepID=A0A219B131_9SPHN|nr:sulfotransferase [Pacificimonas aurantium]MBZ6380070.1 sulfotransferase [Pacificimonas aurantium]OWV32035.1 hypothetical protein B5C34_00225 [Pacificimonas flava]